MWYSYGVMPHCTIEMSTLLSEQIDTQALLEDLHMTLVKSEEFGPADIKVRLLTSDLYLVGGECGEFAHITLKLLSGRSKEIKQGLAKELFLSANEWIGEGNISLTVDVREMDREIYQKKKANL